VDFFDFFETRPEFKEDTADQMQYGDTFINGKYEPMEMDHYVDEPNFDDPATIEDFVKVENNTETILQIKTEIFSPNESRLPLPRVSRRNTVKPEVYVNVDLSSDEENMMKEEDEDYEEKDVENDIGKTLKCDQCSDEFQDQIHLKDHIAVQHQGFLPVKCNDCGSGFSNNLAAKKHFKTHHPDMNYLKQITVHCQFCEYTNKSSTNMRFHKTYKHIDKTFQCDICDKKYPSRSQLQVHKRWNHLDRPHVCQICAKGFVSENLLKHHEKQHENKKKVKCDICGKETRSNDISLAFHYKHKHDFIPDHLPQDIPFFKCEKCPHAFIDPKPLKHHIQMIHGSDEETICVKCGISYTGIHRCYERDHKCSYCEQSFTSLGNLLEHELTLHQQKYDHECDLCGKKFGTYLFLKRHAKYEHQFILPKKANELLKKLHCPLCNCIRTNELSISFHCKSFHGFLPDGMKDCVTFDCPHCSKLFAKASTRDIHVQKMHEDPPIFCARCHVSTRERHRCYQKVHILYQCPHCEEKCKGQSKLLEHVKTIHELVWAFQCLLCGVKKGTQFGMRGHLNQKPHKLKKTDQIKGIHFKEL
jgi:KRAB domain-containing zinc finger protein